MPEFTEADTIRVLVATDNHVGFEERDAIRKDDSWRSFDEIMNLARTEDVDMVLLAGDLFHENKPSRKSLYQVMRTLRQNCLGMKPCPLEFLSDAASVFEGAFTQVNYEDPDINVSIPVFSIHGNHDDPSGDGNFCSLDLLQASGLLNYYGRVPEADRIEAKPILLQKGATKLALFGLSNVRDERMFRTFRDHRVKWFRPAAQTGDWFNLLALHQNHHAHTATSYLPENVLPDWLDLVVWGHEHECLIDPTQNPETGFHVMQPGSSVATSLVPGEAVQKHVAVLSITGRNFKVDKIALKTVRPFVTREILLAQDQRFNGLQDKKDNRHEVTRRLMEVVEEMIEEANAEWSAVQSHHNHDHDHDDGAAVLDERPLPLIRLKVEYTAPEGGHFECENPQRFSNRFVGKVANTNDVVYFYRKKKPQRKANAVDPADVFETVTDESDMVKVESLVQEFLSAQSLKVLPQGPFGDAVAQFVSKDDKHAMELFVSEHLSGQVKQMLGLESDDEDLTNAMEIYRRRIEERVCGADGGGGGGVHSQRERRRVLKRRPDTWDSDFDGHWEDAPDAWTYEGLEEVPTTNSTRSRKPALSSGAGQRRGIHAGGCGGGDKDDDNDKEMATASHAQIEQPDFAATTAHTSGRRTAKSRGLERVGRSKDQARRGRGRQTIAKRSRAAAVADAEGEEEREEAEEDVIMELDTNDQPQAQVAAGRRRAQPTRTSRSTKSSAGGSGGTSSTRGTSAGGKGGRGRGGGKTRQTKLVFSPGSRVGSGTQTAGAVEISDDEIMDDSDAFDPAAATTTTTTTPCRARRW